MCDWVFGLLSVVAEEIFVSLYLIVVGIRGG